MWTIQKFMKLMQQVYNDGGYELLGYADQGFRVMTTNKKIESLADFKGQKIRIHGKLLPYGILEGARSKPDTYDLLGGVYRLTAGNHRCAGKPIRGNRIQ